VVKHSGAHAVRVHFAFGADRLALSIHDDGHGLPRDPGTGRGLANMRRRVGDLGGTLAIASGEGLGLLFELPIPRQG
jgi:signal transduction histidine kinase